MSASASSAKPTATAAAIAANPAAPSARKGAVHKEPLSNVELVLFALFVVIGVVLAFSFGAWVFAVVTARDITHRFAPQRFYIGGNDDVWPEPVAWVLRWLTGTVVDDSIILA